MSTCSTYDSRLGVRFEFPDSGVSGYKFAWGQPNRKLESFHLTMADISAFQDLTLNSSSVTSQHEHSSPGPKLNPTSPKDVFTDYAKYLIDREIRDDIGFDWDQILSKMEHMRGPLVPISRGDVIDSDPVGIIGAGVGGLYAAIILKSLDIPYQILEGSDRIGGRVHTHKFCQKQHETCSDQCQCDYFVSTTLV